MTYERARLRAQAHPQRERGEPVASRSSALREASQSVARVFEKQLLGLPDRAGNLARRAAACWWAETPVGRLLLQVASPLRTALGALPGGSAVAQAAGAGSEVLRRSLAIYAELRAAQDGVRAHRAPRESPKLVHGDFSSRALAASVVRAGITEPVPSERLATSLPEAIRASRSAEAGLLRSYRNFSRGLASQEDLTRAAAVALRARATVTERLHNALGLPSLRDFTAVLGTRGGRSTSAWMGALGQAGLSARAIASGVVESAPLVLASAAAAVAIVSARQLVRAAIAYFRLNVRENLREQQEHRR